MKCHICNIYVCPLILDGSQDESRSIIVVGGWDGSSQMSSVEILDEGSHEWREGPELSFGIDQAQLVEDREVIEVFKRNGCRLTGLLWNLDKLMHKLTDKNKLMNLNIH